MYYPNTCIQLVKLKGDEGVSNLALFGYLAAQIIFKMHDVSVSMQSSVLKSVSSSSPNGQLERAGATGAGQGRAAEGRAGVVSQSYKQWVQWNTEVEGVGGLRTTVGRSRALPHPIGARRTESEAGVGAGGARRSNTVAFRGLDRWFAKVLHKLVLFSWTKSPETAYEDQ